MKNNLSKKLIFGFTGLLAICLFFSFKNYIVLFNTTCGTDFHGAIGIDTHCTDDVTITSVSGDYSEDYHGTIVRASITSDTRVHIIPGTLSVKILPKKFVLTDERWSGVRPSNRAGNSGDTGKSGTQKPAKTFTHTITNQNLIISDIDAVITHYAIYDIYNTPITEVSNVHLTNNTIPIDHLQNDIYIIRIQLENGEVFTKKIAIQ